MIKRYTGASFADVGSRKRWNGSAWVNLTFGRRWSGSAWVDLWNDSGGSGGSGSASGTLVSKVSSTVARPTVNYAATYAATRNGTALTVNLTFAAWLNSSASQLGSGIKLTVYARMNGGAWSSTVIKTTSASWHGTAQHTANITLTGNVTSSKTKIDFYVTRSGSSYSGTAGKLGSASSPKSYTATIPTYGGGGGGNAPDNKDDKYICVKINGTWKQAIPYVKVNGTWKKAVPYIKISGTWKLT